MADFILVATFVLLPAVFGTALYLFFRKFRLHLGAHRRWVKLFVGNMLVLCFLFSFVVLFGELYYRYIYDTTDSFGLTRNSQRWGERHFHVNDSGFRDSVDSYSLTVPIQQRRVTFLGDSFTVGHGIPDVEDRFCNRIRAAHPDWDIHAIAQNGWDSGQQLYELSTSGRSGYELDIVVLVYVLNDISDIVPEWNDILKRIYDSHDPGFLVKHSFLFNTLNFRFNLSNDPDVSNYYSFVRRAYGNEIWKQQQVRLKRYRNEVKKYGGHLLVVTFPFLHNLGSNNEYVAVHEQLDRFWNGLQVPHLDLLREFNNRPGEALVVNKYDAHPNERAHAIAADAISGFIEKQLDILNANEPSLYRNILKAWATLQQEQLSALKTAQDAVTVKSAVNRLNAINRSRDQLRQRAVALKGIDRDASVRILGEFQVWMSESERDHVSEIKRIVAAFPGAGAALTNREKWRTSPPLTRALYR